MGSSAYVDTFAVGLLLAVTHAYSTPYKNILHSWVCNLWLSDVPCASVTSKWFESDKTGALRQGMLTRAVGQYFRKALMLFHHNACLLLHTTHTKDLTNMLTIS